MPVLHEYCTASAQRYPDAIAVRLEDATMTFRELDLLSNRIARLLGAAGCRRGDRVGILMSKSPMAVAAILGALKADCIYVPIDPDSPPARTCRILRSCEPQVILAHAPSAPVLHNLLPELHDVRIGWLDCHVPAMDGIPTDFRLDDATSVSADPPGSKTSDADPAYILYTSGSTGAPKGVVISHRNVVHFVEWARLYFDFSTADRFSGHTPFHFDLSVLDIFGVLAAGAELHLTPPGLNMRPDALADFIRSSSLTQWFSVPAVLNLMMKFNAVTEGDFPSLRRVMWCGEALPIPALRYWMLRLPYASFTNLYGPTEATVASAFYTVSRPPSKDAAAVPIGRPCAGEYLYVVDEQMKLVPQGASGELCIGGAGVGLGYWRDQERTEAAFMTDPFRTEPQGRLYKTGDIGRIDADGLVSFLGRADTQIKSRGYRIELGEIQTALNGIAQLKECVVLAAASDGFENTLICCAYASLPGQAIEPAQIRTELRKSLPAYMIPMRWLELESMPRNTNGKTDLATLREMFKNHETASSGRSAL